MLQRSGSMSVWPGTFRPQTLQDPDKAVIFLGSLVCIELSVSASWFSAHVTSVSPDEEFPDFRPQISSMLLRTDPTLCMQPLVSSG